MVTFPPSAPSHPPFKRSLMWQLFTDSFHEFSLLQQQQTANGQHPMEQKHVFKAINTKPTKKNKILKIQNTKQSQKNCRINGTPPPNPKTTNKQTKNRNNRKCAHVHTYPTATERHTGTHKWPLKHSHGDPAWLWYLRKAFHPRELYLWKCAPWFPSA